MRRRCTRSRRAQRRTFDARRAAPRSASASDALSHARRASCSTSSTAACARIAAREITRLDRDKQPQAIGAQPGLQGRVQFAALCADARREDPQLRRDWRTRAAARPDGLRRRPAPGCRSRFQRRARSRPRVLKRSPPARARSCRSAAPGFEVLHSRKTPRSGSARNGSRQFLPQIRVEGDSHPRRGRENRPRIRLGGRSDIAALGIQDHGDFIRYKRDQIAQRGPAIRAVGLEKSRVGFVRQRQVSRGGDQTRQNSSAAAGVFSSRSAGCGSSPTHSSESIARARSSNL